MIVDDSVTMRKIIGLSLKSQNYDYIEAENGKEAFLLSQKNKIDFFLVDVNMPEMNGFEFVKNIREIADYKKTPIVFITTETENLKKQQGENIGANAWITKPFQKEELIKLIKSLVE
jgi:two-component system chemotaxis response regulator CheY